MPLDHACMTDQDFSCGFKSHAIGEYAIGLSKSNQSLHGLSTCTDFCSEFAQIKTWEKPPIKGKYLVRLRDQSVYSRGMQSSLRPLIGNCLGRSLTYCMLKLQFRLWREAQKVTQFFKFLCWNYTIVVQNINIITHTTHNVHDEDCKRMTLKKKRLREAESKTCEQWIYLLGSEKRVYQKTYSRQIRWRQVRSTTCTQRSLSRRCLKHQSVFCIQNPDLIKSDQNPLLGECAAFMILLFLCYNIYDAVGVSGWLIRQ